MTLRSCLLILSVLHHAMAGFCSHSRVNLREIMVKIREFGNIECYSVGVVPRIELPQFDWPDNAGLSCFVRYY